MNSLPDGIIPVSPSVAKITAFFGKQGTLGPSSLVGNALPHHYPMPDPKDSNDHDEVQEVSNTNNHDHGLGAIEKSGQPQSTVESGKGSGPPDKASYKRFKGKELKE